MGLQRVDAVVRQPRLCRAAGHFRGSSGFGKAFLNAGNREWAGKMHDDLIDAVRWAVREGIADARRVGIYGASYGGYAALVGAALTPEVLASAVNVVGPSNLVTFLRSFPPQWQAQKEQVGGPAWVTWTARRSSSDPDRPC